MFSTISSFFVGSSPEQVEEEFDEEVVADTSSLPLDSRNSFSHALHQVILFVSSEQVQSSFDAFLSTPRRSLSADDLKSDESRPATASSSSSSRPATSSSSSSSTSRPATTASASSSSSAATFSSSAVVTSTYSFQLNALNKALTAGDDVHKRVSKTLFTHIRGCMEREAPAQAEIEWDVKDTLDDEASSVASTRKKSPASIHARQALDLCLQHASLCDEAFAQVLKQLHHNPSRTSIFMGLKLALALLLYFRPSHALSNLLLGQAAHYVSSSVAIASSRTCSLSRSYADDSFLTDDMPTKDCAILVYAALVRWQQCPVGSTPTIQSKTDEITSTISESSSSSSSSDSSSCSSPTSSSSCSKSLSTSHSFISAPAFNLIIASSPLTDDELQFFSVRSLSEPSSQRGSLCPDASMPMFPSDATSSPNTLFADASSLDQIPSKGINRSSITFGDNPLFNASISSTRASLVSLPMMFAPVVPKTNAMMPAGSFAAISSATPTILSTPVFSSSASSTFAPSTTFTHHSPPIICSVFSCARTLMPDEVEGVLIEQYCEDMPDFAPSEWLATSNASASSSLLSSTTHERPLSVSPSGGVSCIASWTADEQRLTELLSSIGGVESRVRGSSLPAVSSASGAPPLLNSSVSFASSSASIIPPAPLLFSATAPSLPSSCLPTSTPDAICQRCKQSMTSCLIPDAPPLFTSSSSCIPPAPPIGGFGVPDAPPMAPEYGVPPAPPLGGDIPPPPPVGDCAPPPPPMSFGSKPKLDIAAAIRANKAKKDAASTASSSSNSAAPPSSSASSDPRNALLEAIRNGPKLRKVGALSASSSDSSIPEAPEAPPLGSSSSSSSSSAAADPRSALLAAITNGIKLRKVGSPPAQSLEPDAAQPKKAAVGNPRDELLAAIRNGPRLRKVVTKEASTSSSSSAASDSSASIPDAPPLELQKSLKTSNPQDELLAAIRNGPKLRKTVVEKSSSSTSSSSSSATSSSSVSFANMPSSARDSIEIPRSAALSIVAPSTSASASEFTRPGTVPVTRLDLNLHVALSTAMLRRQSRMKYDTIKPGQLSPLSDSLTSSPTHSVTLGHAMPKGLDTCVREEEEQEDEEGAETDDGKHSKQADKSSVVIGDDAPPPPPLTATNATAAAKRQDIAASIRAAQSRNSQASAVAVDPRQELLSAIQAGSNLRKVSREQKRRSLSNDHSRRQSTLEDVVASAAKQFHTRLQSVSIASSLHSHSFAPASLLNMTHANSSAAIEPAPRWNPASTAASTTTSPRARVVGFTAPASPAHHKSHQSVQIEKKVESQLTLKLNARKALQKDSEHALEGANSELAAMLARRQQKISEPQK